MHDSKLEIEFDRIEVELIKKVIHKNVERVVLSNYTCELCGDGMMLRPFEIINNSTSKNDNINNPTHYTKGIETLDYILSKDMNFLEGNIIKYVSRYKLKNGIEDLKKAQFYLNKLILEIEKE